MDELAETRRLRSEPDRDRRPGHDRNGSDHTQAAVLATSNTKDFIDTGIHIVNPWLDDVDR